MKRMRFGMAIVLCLGLAGSVTAAGSGNLRYSISVSKFENKAGWSGRWNIGNAFGEIMTAALQESGKFIVLGQKDMRGEAMLEQDLATSGRTAGGKKAPKTGRMTPPNCWSKAPLPMSRVVPPAVVAVSGSWASGSASAPIKPK